MRGKSSGAWLLLFSVALLTTGATPAKARPQDSPAQQDQSVADAARRSRAEKKNAAKQARVISNEDLDTEYFKPAQQGLNLDAPAKLNAEAPNASGKAAGATSSPSGEESRGKGKDLEEEAALDGQIGKLKEEIADAEERLKWQRRELALDQDTVYSNPNYKDSHAGKAKLDAEQQQINERQQEIEVLRTQLEALQERRTQRVPVESASPGG
jgi:hypothetical protein